jgi:L-ascorbate metabolism protein UlaG (beta-lactamase superfamily)
VTSRRPVLDSAVLDDASPEEVPERGLLVTWLGQAGFLLRTPLTTIVIDPYLSDTARGYAGLARVQPPVTSADQLRPDAVLITHPHIDHMDPPTIRALATSPSRPMLIGSAPTVAQARMWGPWPNERVVAVERGDRLVVAGAEITATFARHSDDDLFTGQSIGFKVGVEGIVVWHPGDTEYDARLRHVAPPGEIDVALLPINGTGGNMNAHEAALLAWLLDVAVAVPMHFGMWSTTGYTYDGVEPWATLDPETFRSTFVRLGGTGAVLLPQEGRAFAVSRCGAGRPLAKPP